MKQFRIFAVCCAVLVSGVAVGQVRFDLGIKGGLNFASINTSGTAAANYSNRTGYHAGIYAMLKVTKFAIQPEVIFSRQSQSYAFPSTSNFTSNFDYINIPVIIKFYLAAGLNLQAGPQFGFLSNQTGSLTALASSGSPTTVQIKDLVKTSDVSLALGLGWDLPFGLNLTARYNLGLSDINKYTGGQIPSGLTSSLGTQQAKNQVIQISVGYRLFKLGK